MAIPVHSGNITAAQDAAVMFSENGAPEANYIGSSQAYQ
ncbi:hypothetical protein ebA6039 [Aromatoleum aromaticum EbN1]|uniref:Uncharacterized protein n=1 Tax=Aromatoleum aromaticum (strain DSM 19018 / LMG 30748 / EbN1) TaxID=76114 RepID=Q5NZD9_AROAE|nr:hypothetical protein ebA6039 [Aromatoleum aromaticum EbN1]